MAQSKRKHSRQAVDYDLPQSTRDHLIGRFLNQLHSGAEHIPSRMGEQTQLILLAEGILLGVIISSAVTLFAVRYWETRDDAKKTKQKDKDSKRRSLKHKSVSRRTSNTLLCRLTGAQVIQPWEALSSQSDLRLDNQARFKRNRHPNRSHVSENIADSASQGTPKLRKSSVYQ